MPRSAWPISIGQPRSECRRFAAAAPRAVAGPVVRGGRSDYRPGRHRHPPRSRQHGLGLPGRRAAAGDRSQTQDQVPLHAAGKGARGPQEPRGVLAHQPPAEVAGGSRADDRRGQDRHRRPRDLLLQPRHRHAHPHLRRVQPPGRAQRRSVASASPGVAGELRPAQRAGQPGDRLLRRGRALHGRGPGGLRFPRGRRRRVAGDFRPAARAVRRGRRAGISRRLPGPGALAQPHVRGPHRPGRADRLGREAAGPQCRVLPADPVAARRGSKRAS